MDAMEDRPAHRANGVGIRFSDERRLTRGLDEFEFGDGQARIDCADHLAKVFAVGHDGLLIRFARREIALPKPGAVGCRPFNLAEQKRVDALHHLG